MAHDVFISHSSKDKAIADAVCAALESSGIRCWIAPRDILPGISWSLAITQAISQSRAMVVVFSSNSNQSEHVAREVERAGSKGVALVPFRIEAVTPSETLEYFLSSPHWLDALTPPLERHIRQLAENLNYLLKLFPDQPKAADIIPNSSINDNQVTANIIFGGMISKGDFWNIKVYFDEELVGQSTFREGFDITILTKIGVHKLFLKVITMSKEFLIDIQSPGIYLIKVNIEGYIFQSFKVTLSKIA